MHVVNHQSVPRMRGVPSPHRNRKIMDSFSSGHHITIHGGVGGMGGPGGHVGGAGGNAEGPQFTVSGAENWNVYVAGDLSNYFPSPGNVDPQARWIDSEARNRSSGAVRTLRQIAVPAVAYDASLRPRGVSSNSEEYSTTSFSSTQTPSTQPLKQLTIEQLISPKIQDDVQSLVQSDKLRTLNPQSFDAALRPQCLAGTRQNIITHITEWLTTPSECANILWLHGVAGAGKSTISSCGLNLWFVDAKIQSKSLALGCLHVLNLQLHFNICHLEDSQILNADVPALPALVEKHIPAELKYASLFWSHHLRDTDLDEKILVELKGLIYTRFPYWLEVLSLINQVSVAAGSLETARKCVKTDEAFYNLLRDALSFMAGFAPLIAQSAPHIYISALPFTPHQSLIGKQFASSFPCTLRFTGPVGENWSSILKVFPGHTGRVSSVAFSPDGKQIVSGSVDQTVWIWDSETGDIVAGPFEAHTKWGIAVAFSPDGRLIASGNNLDDEESDSAASEDTSRGGLRLWDAKTGTLVTGPIGDDGIESVAFSPDGKLVVSLTDGMMRLWDVKSGALEELFDKHHHWGSSATFSPDGKRIAYVTPEGVNVWDLETDTEVEGSFDEGMAQSTSISFAPDGKWIVSGSDEPTIGLQVWDSETGSVIPAFLEESSFQVTSITFSPDGKHIIAGGADHRLHVWDSKTGALVGRLRGHTGFVNSVVFSPDGRRIASGSSDRTIRVWDAEVAIGGLANKRFVGHTRGVTCVAFSPDGKQIVSGSADMTVRVWDSKTGALVTTLNAKGNRSVLAISPNRKQIASLSHGLTVCVWNGDTDAVWIFSGYSQCAFSPDGQHIVVGCDRTVKILDSEGGAVISGPFNVPTDQINSVAFSPDGHRVAAGFSCEPVRIWDSQTGAVVIGERTRATSITFSPDGTKLAAGSWKTVRILDVQTGVLLLAVPSEGYNSSLAFSTDGSRIAVGSDSAVCVLDSETGAVVAGPFEGHTEGVTSVHFSPDGRRIVSGSHDSTIRVWELNNDETLLDSWGNHRWFKDDGWIKDSASAHLLWIPPWLRDGLYSPRNSLVIRSGGTTKLDLTQFVHGRD